MEKQQDNKETAKTAVLNTIANALSLVIGMVMIPVISRVIPGEDLGIASTFISTRNCVVILVVFASYAYVNKAMLEFKKEKKEYLLTLSLFCVLMTALAFIVCLPFRDAFKDFLSSGDFLFYWLFISILSYALFLLADYYCIFHNKYTILFFIVMCTGPVGQLVSVGLSYVMQKEKYIGRVIGLDFAYVICSIIFLFWIFAKSKKQLKKDYIKRTLQFTIPIIPHALSQMILIQSDLIMIKYFTDDLKTGIYSMAHTVGFLAFTVMSQIMSTWSPWAYRRLEEKDYTSIRKYSKLIILLGAYVSIGLLTVSTELVNWFLAETYKSCIYLVPPLVLAMFFQFIYLFMYDLEYFYRKSKWIATGSVIAAVLNIVLNIIYIPTFGYGAACYTTMVSYFALFLVNFLFSLKLGAGEVYQLRYIAGITLGVIIYTFLMMRLVDYMIIRFIILLLITAGLGMTQWKKIMGMLANFKTQK